MCFAYPAIFLLATSLCDLSAATGSWLHQLQRLQTAAGLLAPGPTTEDSAKQAASDLPAQLAARRTHGALGH